MIAWQQRDERRVIAREQELLDEHCKDDSPRRQLRLKSLPPEDVAKGEYVSIGTYLEEDES